MNTQEKITKVVKQIERVSGDYEEGNENSLYLLASLTNELTQLAREALGFGSFSGEKEASNEKQ